MYCQDNNANSMDVWKHSTDKKKKIAYQVPVSLIIFVNTEMMDRQQVR